MNDDRTFAADEVTPFLMAFYELAEKEDFSLIAPFIDERAFFRFNDGDYLGRVAIQAVFEKTRRGDPTVKKARFYLSDIVVLTPFGAVRQKGSGFGVWGNA